MKKQCFLGFVAAAMVFALLTNVTRAQDCGDQPRLEPAELAERCIERISELSKERAEANIDIAHDAIDEIMDLLELGQFEEAETVAHRAAYRIRHSSHETVGAIRDAAQRCISVLQRLEKPHLIERVKSECEHAVERVRNSRDRATTKIDDVMPPM